MAIELLATNIEGGLVTTNDPDLARKVGTARALGRQCGMWTRRREPG